MDSLLAHAQRCTRLSDQYARYGLYNEALKKLEESIVHLKQLKSTVTTLSNVETINVQIEQIDRKMRTLVIRESEDAKKKAQIDYLIKTKDLDCVNNHQRYSHGAKLSKDDKSVIEELATANFEYKKINQFLIDEIESLKKENIYLKSELLKCLQFPKSNDDNDFNINEKSNTNKVSSQELPLSNSGKCASGSLNCTVSNDVNLKQSPSLNNNENQVQIDLTRYINSDESDSDDNNMPPIEFTVDS